MALWSIREEPGTRDALQQAGEPARERIANAVIARASTHEQDGQMRTPGLARCIVGTN